MEAMNKMKLGKAAGPSQVNVDMIIASGKFGVGVIKKLCQRELNGKGIPEEWKTRVFVPIFKGKGDVMDDGAYQRRKAAGADSEESAGERNKRIGNDIDDIRSLVLCLGRAQLMHCLFL